MPREEGCVASKRPFSPAMRLLACRFNNAKPAVRCEDGSLRCQTLQDFAWDLALITLKR